MPIKTVEGYPVTAVGEMLWDILDRIKNFDEDSVKNWIKENYPDWKEVYE